MYSAYTALAARDSDESKYNTIRHSAQYQYRNDN